MKKISFKSIKARLSFWFFIMALVPLFIGFLITYNLQKHSIERGTFAKLVAIRDLKVEQVNDWLAERIGDLQAIAGDFEVRGLENIFEKPSKTPEDLKKIEIAKKLLSRYLKTYIVYDEIQFIDAQTGLVELSNNSKFERINRSNDPYFTVPLKTGKTYIKDIYYSAELGCPAMTISMPVYCLDHNTHIIGILVARINLEKSLYQLLANRIGLGETGEMLIVNDSATALNELRNYENAPLKLKIKAIPAVAAAAGETGITKTKDYRGEEVLAAYTYLSMTGWGFVCKQDMYELNAPIRDLVKNIAILFIASVIVVILVILWVINRISKPIINIDVATQRIKRGDYSVRAVVNSSDELASLAGSINEMTASIETRINTQQGVADISEIMINQVSMQGFGSELIKRLMTITQANMSTFYIMNEVTAQYEHFVSIGANEKLLKPFDAAHLEGEVGNAVSNKNIYYLRDIPENTIFSYKTTAGDAIPKEIITVPILVENSVVAIISLVNMHKFRDECYDIIKQSWAGINTSYANLLSSERTRILAEQLALTNQRLDAQSQELQRRSEELHEQNLELEIQRKEIENANRLKSEFLSNMSHELRTPLNSIMALSRVLMMQAKDKLNAEENNYLEIVERNGKELLRLINDILDLAKIEAGRVELSPTHISPGLMLSVIKENLEPLANEKGVAINLQVAEELPDVETDAIKLHQVLSNVIGNAVKFTETGAVNLTLKSDSVNIYFEVEDTGIGIDTDNMPHIFDEFRQVDGSSSRKYEGTGLGLAIAYKITKMLGGDIDVKSTLYQGSLFTITLPIKWPDKIVDTEYTEIEAVLPQLSAKTVLVVDDNPAMIKEISKHLAQAGYNPIGTTSGLKALELAEQYQPFAITLDIIMPDVDGWEVLQKIKNNPKTKHIPVIVVSIVSESATGFALGAVGYVNKPLDSKLLIAEIRKLHENPRTVMIVDDDKLDRKNMGDILNAENIAPVLAESGSKCLRLLDKQVPDVLVLDLLMPGMDGFQVLDNIRKKPSTRDLPTIIVTAKDLTVKDRLKLRGKVSSIIAKSDATPRLLADEIKRVLTELEKSCNALDEKEQPPVTVTATPRKKKNISTVNLPRVLIIEDNPDNMTTVRAILKDNFSIFESEDGEAGLKQAIDILPDIILLDMSLPKMDGVEVVKVLKSSAETAHIPVIAVTARTMKDDKEIFLRAGCDDFFAKPVDPEMLLLKLDEWLSGE
jgi:CheY-like chemotaxis protein